MMFQVQDNTAQEYLNNINCRPKFFDMNSYNKLQKLVLLLNALVNSSDLPSDGMMLVSCCFNWSKLCSQNSSPV